MSHTVRTTAVLVAASMLMLACAVGWVATHIQPAYQTAQAQWAQHRPRHYVMDASWRDGFGDGRSVHVEVRDAQFIAGTDRTTGRPLSALELATATKFIAIDGLFTAIATAERPPAGWRDQIARALPPLAPWLSPCVRPLPDVRYDPMLGYPASLDLRTSPHAPQRSCIRRI